MATYGGGEQKKKDAYKKEYEKRLKSMLPKRAFDGFGRELDPRSGKPLNVEEQLDSLLSDPLEELWELYEAVMPKPQLQDGEPPSYGGPNRHANLDHPTVRARNQLDQLRSQGIDPVHAHQAVYGNVDTGAVESKARLAATLGRVQDDNDKKSVRLEPEKQSILARDAAAEKQLQQTTHDDLRTPMNQQVPDRQQQPVDQVAEDCYNEDAEYLRKYGRA